MNLTIDSSSVQDVHAKSLESQRRKDQESKKNVMMYAYAALLETLHVQTKAADNDAKSIQESTKTEDKLISFDTTLNYIIATGHEGQKVAGTANGVPFYVDDHEKNSTKEAEAKDADIHEETSTNEKVDSARNFISSEVGSVTMNIQQKQSAASSLVDASGQTETEAVSLTQMIQQISNQTAQAFT